MELYSFVPSRLCRRRDTLPDQWGAVCACVLQWLFLARSPPSAKALEVISGLQRGACTSAGLRDKPGGAGGGDGSACITSQAYAQALMLHAAHCDLLTRSAEDLKDKLQLQNRHMERSVHHRKV
uniref:Uncharacterized protein n=1 Tax=Knipowitschia caucasica TaxID=637954 RepID=A0AAV2K2C7_KNICA